MGKFTSLHSVYSVDLQVSWVKVAREDAVELSQFLRYYVCECYVLRL